MVDFKVDYSPSSEIKLAYSFSCKLPDGFKESLVNAGAIMLGVSEREITFHCSGEMLDESPAIQKDLFMQVLSQLDKLT